MVLPATILRQLSSEGVRKLLTTRYCLEFILQSGFRLAFSESTAFREILLVAQKKQPEASDPACTVAQLETMPNPNNTDKIASLLQEFHKTGKLTSPAKYPEEAKLIRVSSVPQETFRETENWQTV